MATPAQVSLIKRLYAEISANPTPEIEKVLEPYEDTLVKVMSDQEIGTNQASNAINVLMAAQKMVPAPPATLEQVELIAAMSADRNNKFGQSLVKQFNAKGKLSERQWAAAKKTWGGPVTVSHQEPEFVFPPEGVHILVEDSPVGDGQIPVVWKVKTSQSSGKLYASRFHPELKTDRWEFVKGGLKGLSEETVATAELAAQFGQLYGICCFCGRGLTDDRSIAVGYGPDCADQRGLPWGDVDQAPEEIVLIGPVGESTTITLPEVPQEHVDFLRDHIKIFSVPVPAPKPEMFEVVAEGSYDPFTGVVEITPEEAADDAAVHALTGHPIEVINGTVLAYTITFTARQLQDVLNALDGVNSDLYNQIHIQYANQKEA